MENIKGVIVDKEYLQKLEDIKGKFAYRHKTIKINSVEIEWQYTYSKEEFTKIINHEFVYDLLNSVGKKSKKSIIKVLRDYGLNADKYAKMFKLNEIKINGFFGRI